MKTLPLAFAGLLLAGAAHAAPSVYPTGVTRYDPDKAWASYLIFTAPDQQTRLIDMNGTVIRHWPHCGFPAEVIDPALNHGRRGDVLLQSAWVEKSKEDPRGFGNGLNNQGIGIFDWNGKVLWEWSKQAPGGAAKQHHDWQKLNNGNLLVLSNRLRKLPGFKLEESVEDVIYEVDPQGEIVWSWAVGDHLDELGFSAEALDLVRNTEHADFFHVNSLKRLGPNKWHEQGDERFKPDNLIIDSREGNFIAIIERSSGRIVWTLGPSYPELADIREAKLPRPVDQLAGLHDANLIAEGLPGAGNILLFDNQGGSGYPPVKSRMITGSRVVEINPLSKEIVWQYSADNSAQPLWAFNSTFISNARRLPNGNTLIVEGMFGRFFQVTPGGEIVWEYVNPYFAKWGKGNALANWSYRATPVPYDWVPAGTPRSEKAVTAPAPSDFRTSH